MRSWSFDPMHPWTTEEALATLPREFELSPRLARTLDRNGPLLHTTSLQTSLAFTFNSYVTAHFYLEFVYYILVSLIALNAVKRLAWPLIVHRLPAPLRRVNTFLIKQLYMSSTFGNKSAAPISLVGANGTLSKATSMQIPVRIHGVANLIFVVATITLMFSNYKLAKPNTYYFALGYPLTQYLRNFADRTGIMSIGLTPLVILLAARNSPLVWLTGVAYPTLQVYHRWVSRMAYLTALSHTLAWSINEALYSAFSEMFEDAYWNWGWAATAGGTVLCFCSTRWLRQLSYEIFLVGHILGAIVWVVGCFYHVWLLDKQYSYLKYIYATIAIWGFERAVRWAMLAWYNLPSFRKSSRKPQGSFAAEGYLIGSGSYLRLRLSPTRSWPKSLGGPGTYVFIRSLDGSFWQSHPFTISWPANMPSVSTPASSPTTTEDDKKGYQSDSYLGHSFDASGSESSTEFELILKSYGGWTKKLEDQLADATVAAGEAHPTKMVKLLVEGPYGSAICLNHYDTVMLVAGGSGISASTSHLADMGKAASRNASSLKVKRVDLVWAIRDVHAVDVLVPYLVRLEPLFRNHSGFALHVHLYYTGRPTTDEEKAAGAPTDDLALIRRLCAPATPFATFSVNASRPDLSAHVQAVLPFDGTRTAVSSCGPELLCDATRIAVRNELGGRYGVQADQLVYHEESFTW